MTPSLVRSALFVPATRPERIPKAIATGADVVIVDLEDAVQETLKEKARLNLDRFLSDNPQASFLVRVNAADHWAHIADLEVCRRHEGVIGVVLPKAESDAQIATAARSGKPVWPIIESARGVACVDSIASAPSVAGLMFGALDLALDMGLKNGTAGEEHILNHARYAVLLATRTAGLPPALNGVFPAIQDIQGLKRAVADARDMGFGGALCIHPDQVAPIHQVFAPEPNELQWARRVLESAHGGDGAFLLDGEMVDAPVIRRAQFILARAR